MLCEQVRCTKNDFNKLFLQDPRNRDREREVPVVQRVLQQIKVTILEKDFSIYSFDLAVGATGQVLLCVHSNFQLTNKK